MGSIEDGFMIRRFPETDAFLRDPGVLSQALRDAILNGHANPDEVQKLLKRLSEIAADGKSRQAEQVEVQNQALSTKLRTALSGKTFRSRIELGNYLSAFADLNGLRLLPRPHDAVMMKNGGDASPQIELNIGLEKYGINIDHGAIETSSWSMVIGWHKSSLLTP